METLNTNLEYLRNLEYILDREFPKINIYQKPLVNGGDTLKRKEATKILKKIEKQLVTEEIKAYSSDSVNTVFDRKKI